jgi:hypothetical protein
MRSSPPWYLDAGVERAAPPAEAPPNEALTAAARASVEIPWPMTAMFDLANAD